MVALMLQDTFALKSSPAPVGGAAVLKTSPAPVGGTPATKSSPASVGGIAELQSIGGDWLLAAVRGPTCCPHAITISLVLQVVALRCYVGVGLRCILHHLVLLPIVRGQFLTLLAYMRGACGLPFLVRSHSSRSKYTGASSEVYVG